MDRHQLTRGLNEAINDGRVRSWSDACAYSLRAMNKPLPPATDLVVRTALSSAAVAETFTSRVGSMILSGYDSEPDSTVEWVAEVPSINFLGSDLMAFDVAARLEKLPRGGVAENATLGVQSERIRIARYAGQLALDEQDIVNGSLVGVVDAAARELGAAARRVKLDLLYALLLSNPTLADDATALFHADHGNLGSVTLTEDNLAAAWSALAGQTLQDAKHGDSIHINLGPKFLIVNPLLATVARKAARNLMLDDDQDLEVRVESRLGTKGVIDPNSDTIVEGSATSWLLAAPQRPGLVVSGLNGSLRPTIRESDLTNGQWGKCFDAVVDIGAAALDFRPLYYSTT
ncbi:MAG: hypothetical protein U1A77_14025 [Pirellulales bacterium]